MVVAMMTPLALPAARYVVSNSLRRRRRVAVVAFYVPFAALWIAVGLGIDAVTAFALPLAPDRSTLLLVTTAVAVAWQPTPWKRRAFRACARSRPLPPTGWRATKACLAFGLDVGARCAATCWPLMMLAASAGAWHGVVAVALTILLIEERSIPILSPTRGRARWILPAAIGAIGLTTMLLGPGPDGASTAAWLCRLPQR
jgi:predicted metal-binding membrane protein